VRRPMLRWAIAFVILAVVASTQAMAGSPGPLDRTTRYSTTTGKVSPDARGAAPAQHISRARATAIQNALLRLRDRSAARALKSQANGVAALPRPRVTETRSEGAESEFHGSPSAVVVGRNNANTTAGVSTIAEPAAANDGVRVFMTANWYASYSTTGGASWNTVPIPAGGSSAPVFCCDSDVIYDKARGVTFWSAMYIRPIPNTNPLQVFNAETRIFVIRNIPSSGSSSGASCSYTFDPDGANNNVVADYPHLGLSNDFLYLTTNELEGDNLGGDWLQARVRRIPLDAMVDCTTVIPNTFIYNSSSPGQRVFVPVSGAHETMYWGQLESCSTITGGQSCSAFRIYSWPEASASPTSVLKAISSSIHRNPDCRGGTNNTDWLERSTSFSAAGFRIRGAAGKNLISFFWNAAPNGASRPQAYARGAVFRESDKVLVSQPDVFNSGTCFGYPNVGANDRGDLGLVVAFGGKAGGGGSAVRTLVGVRDDITTGAPFGSTLNTVATGTHNPADARFGDYFTIHAQEPCGLFWNATAYALSGGTSAANVNDRYVEFGRGRDGKCYTGWRDFTRVP
jgi:hypothetical protein